MSAKSRLVAMSIAMLFGLPTAGSAVAAPVAFVEASEAVKDLATVIRVERGARSVAVKGRYFNLDAGDEITLRDPRVEVTVHYLGNNAAYRVRRAKGSPKGLPDYSVRALTVPTLSQAVFNWLVGQVAGTPAAHAQQEITASSRSSRRGMGCSATVAGTPAALQFRGARHGSAKIVADARPVVLSWIGGVAPYAMEAIPADGVAGQPSVATTSDGCFAQLDGKVLSEGTYRLALRDGRSAATALNLEAVKTRPAMPAMLAEAALDELSRQLYYATWLNGVEDGAWSLEAQRIVLEQDCKAAAVRDWLDTAALGGACD